MKRKYHNRKTVVEGITFDSKKEASRYIELKQAVKQGIIKDLVLQPRFELQESFKLKGKTIRKIEYVADFSYTDVKNGNIVVEDVKGIKTDVFKIKEKLFLKRYGTDVEFKIL